MPGTITVRPIQAKLDTSSGSSVQRLDPFCVAIVGKNHVESKVCKKGGLNPKWEDSLSLSRNQESYCYVEVKDKTLLKDKMLGVCAIDLDVLPGQECQQKWYDLYYQQKPVGEILVETVYTPEGTEGSRTSEKLLIQDDFIAPSSSLDNLAGRSPEMMTTPTNTRLGGFSFPGTYESGGFGTEITRRSYEQTGVNYSYESGSLLERTPETRVTETPLRTNMSNLQLELRDMSKRVDEMLSKAKGMDYGVNRDYSSSIVIQSTQLMPSSLERAAEEGLPRVPNDSGVNAASHQEFVTEERSHYDRSSTRGKIRETVHRAKEAIQEGIEHFKHSGRGVREEDSSMSQQRGRSPMKDKAKELKQKIVTGMDHIKEMAHEKKEELKERYERGRSKEREYEGPDGGESPERRGASRGMKAKILAGVEKLAHKSVKKLEELEKTAREKRETEEETHEPGTLEILKERFIEELVMKLEHRRPWLKLHPMADVEVQTDITFGTDEVVTKDSFPKKGKLAGLKEKFEEGIEHIKESIEEKKTGHSHSHGHSHGEKKHHHRSHKKKENPVHEGLEKLKLVAESILSQLHHHKDQDESSASYSRSGSSSSSRSRSKSKEKIKASKKHGKNKNKDKNKKKEGLVKDVVVQGAKHGVEAAAKRRAKDKIHNIEEKVVGGLSGGSADDEKVEYDTTEKSLKSSKSGKTFEKAKEKSSDQEKETTEHVMRSSGYHKTSEQVEESSVHVHEQAAAESSGQNKVQEIKEKIEEGVEIVKEKIEEGVEIVKEKLFKHKEGQIVKEEEEVVMMNPEENEKMIEQYIVHDSPHTLKEKVIHGIEKVKEIFESGRKSHREIEFTVEEAGEHQAYNVDCFKTKAQEAEIQPIKILVTAPTDPEIKFDEVRIERENEVESGFLHTSAGGVGGSQYQMQRTLDQIEAAGVEKVKDFYMIQEEDRERREEERRREQVNIETVRRDNLYSSPYELRNSGTYLNSSPSVEHRRGTDVYHIPISTNIRSSPFRASGGDMYEEMKRRYLGSEIMEPTTNPNERVFSESLLAQLNEPLLPQPGSEPLYTEGTQPLFAQALNELTGVASNLDDMKENQAILEGQPVEYVGIEKIYEVPVHTSGPFAEGLAGSIASDLYGMQENQTAIPEGQPVEYVTIEKIYEAAPVQESEGLIGGIASDLLRENEAIVEGQPMEFVAVEKIYEAPLIQENQPLESEGLAGGIVSDLIEMAGIVENQDLLEGQPGVVEYVSVEKIYEVPIQTEGEVQENLKEEPQIQGVILEEVTVKQQEFVVDLDKETGGVGIAEGPAIEGEPEGFVVVEEVVVEKVIVEEEEVEREGGAQDELDVEITIDGKKVGEGNVQESQGQNIDLMDVLENRGIANEDVEIKEEKVEIEEDNENAENEDPNRFKKIFDRVAL